MLMEKIPTDANLVRGYLAGKDKAFDKLYKRYERPLFSFILRFVGNRSHAEELFQQTWMKVLKGLHKYKEEGKFSSWLFRIGYRKALDLLRRRRRGMGVLRKMESRSDGAETGKKLEEKQTAVNLERAMDALKPDHRAALHLYYKEDRSYKEIAAVMKIPINTVKSHIRRGKDALRKKLELSGEYAGRNIRTCEDKS